jgi:hypothetical protein
MGGDYSQLSGLRKRGRSGSCFCPQRNSIQGGRPDFLSKKFVLADFHFARRKELFFEMNGRWLVQYHSQMSGNPVKFRDGCATVTATNSNATEKSGRRKAV